MIVNLAVRPPLADKRSIVVVTVVLRFLLHIPVCYLHSNINILQCIGARSFEVCQEGFLFLGKIFFVFFLAVGQERTFAFFVV